MQQNICNLVFSIFEQPSCVDELNATLITLIPKLDNVVWLKNFHLISLCNVSYKIGTKILVDKLQLVMKKSIHPCLCNFISNRRDANNIVVDQEIFHSMRGKK